MIREIQMWAVGNIVPLAIGSVLFCSVIYFLKYRDYLQKMNTYSNSWLLKDLFMRYAFARWNHQQIKRSIIWRYFFGERYARLVSDIAQRFIYELDQLDHFSDAPEDTFPVNPRPTLLFDRTSFIGQWRGIHHFLFIKNFNENDEKGVYHKMGTEYAPLGKDFEENPLGPLNEIFITKMCELFKKEALYLLRKKGLRSFCYFIKQNTRKSLQYRSSYSPLSVLDQELVPKILHEYEHEIKERIHHEITLIQSHKKLSPNEKSTRLNDLSKLVKDLLSMALVKKSVPENKFIFTGGELIKAISTDRELINLMEKA